MIRPDWIDYQTIGDMDDDDPDALRELMFREASAVVSSLDESDNAESKESLNPAAMNAQLMGTDIYDGQFYARFSER